METLFKSVKGQILERDILQFNEENYENELKYFAEKFPYKKIIELLEREGAEVSYLKIIKNRLTPIHYLNDKGVCIPIPSVAPEMIKYQRLESIISTRSRKFEKLLDRKNYEEFFRYISTYSPESLFYEFMKRVHDIPQNDRYRIFRSFHSRVEYGFEEMLINGLESIIDHQKGKYPMDLLKPLLKDDKGRVKIYRGVLSESTAPEKAYSWTSDISVAARFATRFGKTGGQIYSAYACPENISDFIIDRNEKEVIVLPKYLEDIAEVHLDTIEDTEFQNWMAEEFIINEYNLLTEKLMDKKSFRNYAMKTGVHDIKHMKKVLLLSLILANKVGLPERERMILAYCSIYHDIGRKYDEVDETHGLKSIEIMREEKVFEKIRRHDFYLEKKDIPLIEFIIKYHCMNDSDAYDYLKRKGVKDNRYKVLYRMFKDADALDRVRFDGLNTEMLRLKESKNLILLAYQLQSQI